MPVALSLKEESLKDSTSSIDESYIIYYFDNLKGMKNLLFSDISATMK